MKKFIRISIIVLVILLLLGGLLALDLANRGLAWQVFWSLTGEETPLAQIRGIVEWAGTFTRQQPNLAADVPIQYTHLHPYGINTFLQLEVEESKREEQVRMIAEAGFTWIRQQFPWEDIEVDGRGLFTDSRNDLNGDGLPDTVDAWAKYDQIVDLAERYNLNIQVRLDQPPSWAHANPEIGESAPPDDLQDYVNYAIAVAERYRGRLIYYQIWNEPNIYPEWGNQAVNPELYTELLCRTYAALKAVDPNIVVISGAMAPTVSLTGRDLNDFVYLQRMYDADVRGCFDVMAVNGYGLNSGPTDQRMRSTTVNFARNLYIRDIMVANGDAHKPIWISEAAWNPVPDDPAIENPLAFGQVTLEQAARYMPLAYERAQREWSWVGVIFYWFFTRPDDSERNQPQYYFRMVEPDYSPDHPTFTPFPIYHAMQEHILNNPRLLYPGVHQAEDWRIEYPVGRTLFADENAQFGEAVHAELMRIRVYGTDLLVRTFMPVTPVPCEGGTSGIVYEAFTDWHEQRWTLSTTAAYHCLLIVGDLSIDSITVLDRTSTNLFPLIAGSVVMSIFLLWVVVSALLTRRRKAA